MNHDDAAGGLRGLRALQTEELIDTVCGSYGFQGVEDVTDLGGSSSLNLRIETGDCRYVARVYRPYVTQMRLQDIQHVRRRLAARGVPCSAPLLTQNKQSFVAFDNRLVEVEHYVEHDAIMDSWDRLESTLPLLGHIHTLLETRTVGLDGKYPTFANYIDPQELVARTHRGAQRIRGWASSAAERNLADAAVELAAGVAVVGRDRITTLPRQLVHGDFWHDNVLFFQGDIALVTDFDFMGERTRINDLALTLYFASCEFAKEWLPDEQIVRVGQLVDAYDSGLDVPLSNAERAALPLALASQPLWSIGGWVALLDDPVTARHHAAGMTWALEWALAIVHHMQQWQTALDQPRRR